MQKLSYSLATLAMLSGAVIAAPSEKQRGSDASDASQSDVYLAADGAETDAVQSRNSGRVHGKVLQEVNGAGRITAWLQDAGGKNRMLMLADMAQSGSQLSLAGESGSVFGYLYSAGQPDPHKTKSGLVVIGSYIKAGNLGSFDLAIFDRRQMGSTSHVQMLGRIKGSFGQDGQIALLTQTPQSADGRAFIDPVDAGPLAGDSADARRGRAQVTKSAGSDGSGPYIDPIDAGPSRADSADGRRQRVQQRPQAGDDATDAQVSGPFIDPIDAASSAGDSVDGQGARAQLTKPAEPMVFVAGVVGLWQLN